MLSATSNIELEFFTNFLNMFKSKIPISTNFAVSEGAVTYSPDFMHDVPVMKGKLALKTSPHHPCNPLGVQTGDFASELWHNHLLRFGGILRSCFLQSIEPASSTGCC